MSQVRIPNLVLNASIPNESSTPRELFSSWLLLQAAGTFRLQNCAPYWKKSLKNEIGRAVLHYPEGQKSSWPLKTNHSTYLPMYSLNRFWYRPILNPYARTPSQVVRTHLCISRTTARTPRPASPMCSLCWCDYRGGYGLGCGFQCTIHCYITRTWNATLFSDGTSTYEYPIPYATALFPFKQHSLSFRKPNTRHWSLTGAWVQCIQWGQGGQISLIMVNTENVVWGRVCVQQY